MESSVESEVVTNLNMESSFGAKTVPEGTDGAVDDNGASQFADGPNEPRSYVNADSYASRAARTVVFLLINQPGGFLLIPRLMICRNAPEHGFIYAITFPIGEICL